MPQPPDAPSKAVAQVVPEEVPPLVFASGRRLDPASELGARVVQPELEDESEWWRAVRSRVVLSAQVSLQAPEPSQLELSYSRAEPQPREPALVSARVQPASEQQALASQLPEQPQEREPLASEAP